MSKKLIVVAHFYKTKINSNNFNGVEWRRSENGEGYLYVLKNEGETTPIQFWERKGNDKISSLRELMRIKTLHSIDNGQGREGVSYAAPLYSEVLEQIPKKALPKIVAFEVLVGNFSRSDFDGPDGYDIYDEITTVLYEKK